MNTNLLAMLRITEFTNEARISSVKIICPPGCVVQSKIYNDKDIVEMTNSAGNIYSVLEKRLAIINCHIVLGFAPLFATTEKFENGGIKEEITATEIYMKTP